MKDTKTKKILAAAVGAIASLALGFAQSTTPAHVSPADAKNHIGEIAIICGKVVDTKVNKYGIAGHGKPVLFDLDHREPDVVFYFVTFGSKDGGPEEAIAAYKDRSVCVTGKIVLASGIPYIMAADRSNIKTKTGN